jgi:hypothetical protein
MHLAAMRAQRLNCLIDTGLSASADRHVCTGAREYLGDRASDAATASGNDQPATTHRDFHEDFPYRLNELIVDRRNCDTPDTPNMPRANR